MGSRKNVRRDVRNSEYRQLFEKLRCKEKGKYGGIWRGE